MCAHACQLLGASLFVSSRSTPGEWVSLALAIPNAAIDGLLQCLSMTPARARAARALFYVASAPLPNGTGGEVIESQGGVPVRSNPRFTRSRVGGGLEFSVSFSSGSLYRRWNPQIWQPLNLWFGCAVWSFVSLIRCPSWSSQCSTANRRRRTPCVYVMRCRLNSVPGKIGCIAA